MSYPPVFPAPILPSSDAPRSLRPELTCDLSAVSASHVRHDGLFRKSDLTRADDSMKGEEQRVSRQVWMRASVSCTEGGKGKGESR